MTLDAAIHAIQNAADRFQAGAVRNAVALEALRGIRPEADANACRKAFHDRWAADLMNQATYEETIRGNFRGD